MSLYKEFLSSKTESDLKKILNPYFEKSGNFFQVDWYICDSYKVILKYFHFMIYEEFVKENQIAEHILNHEYRLKVIKGNLYVNDFHQIGSKIGNKRACTPKDVKTSFSVLQNIFTREKLVEYLFTFDRKDQLSNINFVDNMKNTDEYKEAMQEEELEQWRLEKEYGIKIKPVSNIDIHQIPEEFISLYQQLNKEKLEYESLKNMIYDGMNYQYEERIYNDLEYVAEKMLTIFREHTLNYEESKIDWLLDFLFLKDEFLYSDVVSQQMGNRYKFENILYSDISIRHLKRAEAERNTIYSNKYKQIFDSATYRHKPILDKKKEEERERRRMADEAYRMRYEL